MRQGVKIDKRVPTPDDRNGVIGRTPSLPWQQLEPGHSFFVPGPRISISGWRERRPDWTFITRKTTENEVAGHRYWRTK
jgi:hypothetical protein